MSTSYEFRCGCGERWDGSDSSNHAEAEMARLLAARPVLASLGLSLRDRSLRDAAERLFGFDWMAFGGLARWFADHDGHEIRLFDEYGHESGKCGGWARCGGCGSTVACGLPVNHAGHHAPNVGITGPTRT